MTSASDDMAPRDPKFPSVPFCSSVSRSQNWEPRDLVAPDDQLRQVKTRDRQRAAAKPLQIAQLRIGVSAGLTDTFPCNHRHSSCRQHPNVGCTRGQASTPHPHRDHVRQYTNPGNATVGAVTNSECKNPGNTVCADECTDTDVWIGTTRPSTGSAGLSANRGDTGRYRLCVRADCNRCDDPARRDCGCCAGCKPQGCINQRCRQSIGLNYMTAQRILLDRIT
jgi:hypothetical protein